MKACHGCHQVLPADRFPPDRRARDGKQSRCRACINAFIKQHYREHPVEHMLRRARARAVRKGIDFSLSAVDIVPLPTHCPVFGIQLTLGDGAQNPSAYSLDRIDNSKGYVRGNVRVISYLANRLKNDGTAEQHRIIADWMERELAQPAPEIAQ